MSNFLMRLILRSTPGVATLRPRPRSRYESSPAGSAPVLESTRSDRAEPSPAAPSLRKAPGDTSGTPDAHQVHLAGSKQAVASAMAHGSAQAHSIVRNEPMPQPMHSDGELSPTRIDAARPSESDSAETRVGTAAVLDAPSPSPAGHSILLDRGDAEERVRAKGGAAPAAGAAVNVRTGPRAQTSGHQPEIQQFPAGAGSGGSGPPIVKISIGRVEVRAMSPAPAPVRSWPAPRLSLEEYLRRRQGAER